MNRSRRVSYIIFLIIFFTQIVACDIFTDSSDSAANPDPNFNPDTTAFNIVGSYKSTIIGSDSGTLYFTIDGENQISGIIIPTNSPQFQVEGRVDTSNKILLFSSLGFEFEGEIYDDETIDGTWNDHTQTLEGFFSGEKLLDDVVETELLSVNIVRAKSCIRTDADNSRTYCRDSLSSENLIYCPTASGYKSRNSSCPTEDKIGICPSGKLTNSENRSSIMSEHYYTSSEKVVISDAGYSKLRFFDAGKASCKTQFQEFASPINPTVAEVLSCSRVKDGKLLHCRDRANAGGNVGFVEGATLQCPAADETTLPGSRVCPLEDRVSVCLAGTYTFNGIIAINGYNDNYYKDSKTTIFRDGYSFYELTFYSCPPALAFDVIEVLRPDSDINSFDRQCPPFCDTMGNVHSAAAEAGIILPPTSLEGGNLQWQWQW